MVIVVMAGVAGVCAGVCAASASTPRVRIVPSIAATVLALIAAAALVRYDPTNLAAALVLVAGTLSGFVLSSAALWRSILPDLSARYGWYVATAFLHPGHLRNVHRARRSEPDRETTYGRRDPG